MYKDLKGGTAMSMQRYDLDYQDSGRDFKLLYISRSKCENDWHSLPHSHYCAELFYIMSGKGFFRVESQQFPIHPGDLVVVNPCILHTELSFVDHPLDYIVMGIDGVQFQQGDSLERRFFHLPAAEISDDYRFYMETILRESADRNENYLEVCAGLTQVFLALLRRLSHRRLSVSQTRSTSECARVKQYMDEHFTEDISLDTLAGLSHMNKHYLVHAFNKEVGCSPISYLLARRIAESKHLLENSNDSVSQVGLRLGFSSPSYFSQRFKKAVGITPMEYRRAVRSQSAGLTNQPQAVYSAVTE